MLKGAQPAVPQQVHINSIKLPRMKMGDDLELFVTLLETAMLSAGMPTDKWKGCLHSQLTLNAKYKALHLLQNPDSTYDELKEALLGCVAMTFPLAAEAILHRGQG